MFNHFQMTTNAKCQEYCSHVQPLDPTLILAALPSLMISSYSSKKWTIIENVGKQWRCAMQNYWMSAAGGSSVKKMLVLSSVLTGYAFLAMQNDQVYHLWMMTNAQHWECLPCMQFWPKVPFISTSMLPGCIRLPLDSNDNSTLPGHCGAKILAFCINRVIIPGDTQPSLSSIDDNQCHMAGMSPLCAILGLHFLCSQSVYLILDSKRDPLIKAA